MAKEKRMGILLRVTEEEKERLVMAAGGRPLAKWALGVLLGSKPAASTTAAPLKRRDSAVQVQETERSDPAVRVVVDHVQERPAADGAARSAGTVVLGGSPDRGATCPDACMLLHVHTR